MNEKTIDKIWEAHNEVGQLLDGRETDVVMFSLMALLVSTVHKTGIPCEEFLAQFSKTLRGYYDLHNNEHLH
jgi:hypothetical protein